MGTTQPDMSYAMLVEPRQMDQGICVAGALLPPRTHNVPTRIVNVSNRHIRLEKGDVLSEVQVLRDSQILDEDPENTDSERHVDDEWLEDLVDNVHSSVTAGEREKLRTVLRSYADCFSRHSSSVQF